MILLSLSLKHSVDCTPSGARLYVYVCVHQRAAVLVGGVMLEQPTDSQLCLRFKINTIPVKMRWWEWKRKKEMTGNTDGTCLWKSSLKPFFFFLKKREKKEDSGVGGCGEGGVGETDQQKDTSQWAIDRRTDKQTDKTVSPAQKQADRLTEGINVYLIVHCSVVVSPLHPAKWLLINQPDLLLFHSADRLLVSGRWRVVIDPAWMTKDHQQLLKHNSSLSCSLFFCQSTSLSLSLWLLPSPCCSQS